MNKNYYHIDFNRLAVLLLPTMLRKKMIVAFLSAILRPVSLIYSLFQNYTESINTESKSQICYLQALLNDLYDYHERRIVVRDAGMDYTAFFLYSEDKGNASIVSDEGKGNAILWMDNGKLGATVPDFEVVFPLGYVLSENEEKALKRAINTNKLASKKYRIVYE